MMPPTASPNRDTSNCRKVADAATCSGVLRSWPGTFADRLKRPEPIERNVREWLHLVPRKQQQPVGRFTAICAVVSVVLHRQLQFGVATLKEAVDLEAELEVLQAQPKHACSGENQQQSGLPSPN
jgi:hypothetical protein